jgi:pimeloyl-ACP methyl ester carboxylesterase
MAVEINYERRGSGETLVLIHGIGSCWQMWTPVLDTLASERDVIALDLPGFAGSPMPEGNLPPGVPTLTDLVLQFLAQLGVSEFHVAGNSMGGAISLELARRGAVKSATALSPGGFESRAEAALTTALLLSVRSVARASGPVGLKLMESTVGRKLTLSSLVRHPERLPPDLAKLWVQQLVAAKWFESTLFAITSSREQFSGEVDLAVPVTIAWGQHDHVLLPRQAARALQKFKSAHYVLLRDCGHVPTCDDPELVAQVLLEGSSF